MVENIETHKSTKALAKTDQPFHVRIGLIQHLFK